MPRGKMHRMKPARPVPPGFLVVLEDRSIERKPAAVVSPEKQRLLWALTPSEREVALLLAEGCSNGEIVKRLKKS